MPKTDFLAVASPGSRALKTAKNEKYCRLRASALPRIAAYREAGWHSKKDDVAYANACRLERRPGVRERIEYLSHQEEELIAEKRRRIEEMLWAIHEADIGDYFETHEIDGKTIESKAIEHVQVDARGNAVPQLYSKLQANAELRKMLNIGGQKERLETDVSRLSDAELIQQLANQAKELGIEIDLNYRFHKRDE
jgi:hypothetical protein